MDLLQSGRTAEAEAEFEKLLGGVHVKCAYAELSKSDRVDDADAVTLSDLLQGRYFKGKCTNNVITDQLIVSHIFLTPNETFFFL